MNKISKNFLFVGILICLISKTAHCQSVKIILKNSSKLLNGKYHIYEPILKIQARYKDTTEAKNETPEELMTSIVSSNSKLWEKYNAAEFDENESYTFVKGIEYELLSKLEFEIDSLPMAIIKFKLIKPDEVKKIVGVAIIKKNSKRWKTTSSYYVNRLSIAFLVFRENIMQNLILKNPKNNIEKKLLEKCYSNGLDIEKLLSQDFTKEQKEYFINPLNW